jgi:acrylyl-CoA reductase (NADPH)/3-hydroxypropionyl-CoA dehydratase/3-hydroxypropionyl-CoA synthetase
MAAAKRLGLTYVAIAAGTVADVLADRLSDTAACVVLTSDALLPSVDEALACLRSSGSERVPAAMIVPLDDDPPSVQGVQRTHEGSDESMDGSTDEACGTPPLPDITATPLVSSVVGNSSSSASSSRSPHPSSPTGISPETRQLLWRCEPPLGAALLELMAQSRLSSHAIDSPHDVSQSALAERSDVPLLWRVVPPHPVDASHPLFILYTSGSTGKPKGIVHVRSSARASPPGALQASPHDATCRPSVVLHVASNVCTHTCPYRCTVGMSLACSPLAKPSSHSIVMTWRS